MANNAAKLVQNSLSKLLGNVNKLARNNEVLVGVPRDESARQTNEMNNATLAYIHDKGSPAANIPARPFMDPGIKDVQDKIAKQLAQGAKGLLVQNDASVINTSLNRAGLIAQNSIKRVINNGIAPALALSTLQARARRGRKGAKTEIASREAGNEATLTNAKPLVDTGQLRNSITYVVNKK